MNEFELAQINIATMKAPLEDPIMRDFVENIDRINELAEKVPGFVWRLRTEEGDATAYRPLGDHVLINMSVWKDLDSLKAYVYDSAHTHFVRRRKAWFEPMREAFSVMWWIPTGHRPSIPEGLVRLDQIRTMGPTPTAFSFKVFFPPSL